MSFDVLTGIRVLDLGIITAGASTSAILADLGAEVIKVEGPSYTDPFRFWTGGGGERWWDESPHFAFTNRNKKSCCVDLKSAEGRALLLDLVARSHVVVENFRVGVLAGLGLGFDALASRNPRIVLASISSQGLTGPDADSVSFGSTLEGSSGLASLIRDEEGVPQISGHVLNYPDQVVSLFAAGAIASALLDVRRTGRGLHLDLSQRELAVFMLGEMLDGAALRRTPRGGSGASLDAVVGTIDRRWIAVSIAGSDEARRVSAGLGIPSPISRQALARWAGSLAATEAVAALRRCGCTAAVVRRAAEMVERAAQEGSDAIAFDADGRPAKGLPWRIGDRPLTIGRQMPSLGADNELVACGLAGRSAEDYRRLVEAGVLATEPRSRPGEDTA